MLLTFHMEMSLTQRFIFMKCERFNTRDIKGKSGMACHVEGDRSPEKSIVWFQKVPVLPPWKVSGNF